MRSHDMAAVDSDQESEDEDAWWDRVRHYRLSTSALEGVDALLATANEIVQEGRDSAEDVLHDLEAMVRSQKALAECMSVALDRWKASNDQ